MVRIRTPRQWAEEVGLITHPRGRRVNRFPVVPATPTVLPVDLPHPVVPDMPVIPIKPVVPKTPKFPFPRGDWVPKLPVEVERVLQKWAVKMPSLMKMNPVELMGLIGGEALTFPIAKVFGPIGVIAFSILLMAGIPITADLLSALVERINFGYRKPNRRRKAVRVPRQYGRARTMKPKGFSVQPGAARWGSGF